jgi:CDP-glucose 4,6-dehydratase
MAPVAVNKAFWAGRRVLLTGHTGFKGSWLALWLQQLGAEVTALALAPDSEPSLFDILRPAWKLHSRLGDIRNADAVGSAVAAAMPEIVIHMAAQALVRRSYREPLVTFESNVIGTARLLDAVRAAHSVKTVLVVTSDKVYENSEGERAFTEAAPLGGHDPYSASKAAAEIATAAWATSFLRPVGIAVATARAGNVIGGGDFAEDRIVPDIWRAARAGKPLELRHPQATRPWQHVLDPLAGYLAFAERLAAGGAAQLPPALNFGPRDVERLTVAVIANRMLAALGAAQSWTQASDPGPAEKQTLALDTSLARRTLGWRSKLGIGESLEWTAAWYRAYGSGQDMVEFTRRQIERYEALP